MRRAESSHRVATAAALAVGVSLSLAPGALGQLPSVPSLPDAPEVPQVPLPAPELPSAPPPPSLPTVPQVPSPQLPSAPDSVGGVAPPSAGGSPSQGGSAPPTGGAGGGLTGGLTGSSRAAAGAGGTQGKGSAGSASGTRGARGMAAATPAERRAAARRHFRRLVHRTTPCFHVLTPVQADVLRLRAGVGAAEPHSRREAAGRLDIPVGKVRRSERVAVRRLVRADRSTGCGIGSIGRVVEEAVSAGVAWVAGLFGSDSSGAPGVYTTSNAAAPRDEQRAGGGDRSDEDTSAVAGATAMGEAPPAAGAEVSEGFPFLLLLLLLVALMAVAYLAVQRGRRGDLAIGSAVTGAVTGAAAGLRRRPGGNDGKPKTTPAAAPGLAAPTTRRKRAASGTPRPAVESPGKKKGAIGIPTPAGKRSNGPAAAGKAPAGKAPVLRRPKSKRSSTAAPGSKPARPAIKPTRPAIKPARPAIKPTKAASTAGLGKPKAKPGRRSTSRPTPLGRVSAKRPPTLADRVKRVLGR